jgi:hypothetical protein
MKLRPGFVLAMAGWGVGILGLVAFLYAMGPSRPYIEYACIFSPCGMLIFFLVSAVSFARGGMDMFTPKENGTSLFTTLQTMTGMALGCLGVIVSFSVFSILLYLAHLYTTLRTGS